MTTSGICGHNARYSLVEAAGSFQESGAPTNRPKNRKAFTIRTPAERIPQFIETVHLSTRSPPNLKVEFPKIRGPSSHRPKYTMIPLIGPLIGAPQMGPGSPPNAPPSFDALGPATSRPAAPPATCRPTGGAPAPKALFSWILYTLHINKQVCIYIHLNNSTCMYNLTYICIYVHTCTYVHVYIYMHIHKHIHAHTYIYIHIYIIMDSQKTIVSMAAQSCTLPDGARS